jgi:endonuclease YncB( thermonuclease family)
MRVGIKTLAALVLLALVPAGRSSAERVTGHHVVIIDGDTISILGERIRLMDIDTPEMSKPRCEAELVRGLQAKELLGSLLRTADAIQIERAARPDRYGRTVKRRRILTPDRRAILALTHSRCTAAL